METENKKEQIIALCRGVREDTGATVFGYYVVFNSHSEGKDPYLHIIIDENGQYNRVIPETVGRFTGLTDIDGNDIYEGDILMCNDNPGDLVKVVFGKFNVILLAFGQKVDSVIGWHIEVLATKNPHSKELPFSCPMPIKDNYIKLLKMKIVGNIHDNPELVEGVS